MVSAEVYKERLRITSEFFLSQEGGKKTHCVRGGKAHLVPTWAALPMLGPAWMLSAQSGRQWVHVQAQYQKFLDPGKLRTLVLFQPGGKRATCMEGLPSGRKLILRRKEKTTLCWWQGCSVRGRAKRPAGQGSPLLPGDHQGPLLVRVEMPGPLTLWTGHFVLACNESNV